MWVLTRLNSFLSKLSYSLAMLIVAIMVMALSLSAITRYVSGTGYDWLIELPPILVCWLVFPLLGPLLKEGNHIQVDFLSSLVSPNANKYIKISMNITAFFSIFSFLQSRVWRHYALLSTRSDDGVGIRYSNMVDVLIVSSRFRYSCSIFNRNDYSIYSRHKKNS